MRKMTAAALAAATMGLAAASPAAAAMATLTYYGTFNSGVDSQGFFGDVGGDLSGKSFTAVYTMNDQAARASHDVPGPEYDYLANDGLFAADATTSAVIGRITVGSKTLSFDQIPEGNYAYEHRTDYSDGSFSQLMGYVTDNHYDGATLIGGDLYFYVNHYGPAFFSGMAFDSPVDYLVQRGDDGIGVMNLYSNTNGQIGYGDSFSMKVSRVVVAAVEPTQTPVGGVPEPATWALMIAGFGLTGAALRRRTVAA